MKKSYGSFIKLIFASFFRWWWAVITGVASIGSWFYTPETGILLSPKWIGIFIFVICTLLFLVISVLHQSWKVYKKQDTGLKIIGFRKCDAYDSEYVFVLEGFIESEQNTLIELRRYYEGVEIPVGLVEILEKNSKGQYQAKPIWISPGHLRELKMGEFVYSDLKAKPEITLRTVKKAKDKIIK